MSNTFTQRLSHRKLLVDVLAAMFGLAAWIGINGIFMQLPLLVDTAPEGWDLASYMVILIQIANLGPILYTLYTKYSTWVRDHYIIYGLLGTATLAVYSMAFTYERTSLIGGVEHSTALLGLLFLTAIVGCTSSVLFLPYMRNYREIYLVSYLVGEGLSGFIPSIAALIQGVGGNPECISNSTSAEPKYYNAPPRFSSTSYFLFLGTLLLLALLSFIGLNLIRVARGERVKPPGCTEVLPTETNAPPSYKTNAEWTMSKQMYLYLLSMMGIICFLGHSALPSIQPFSCLPYGNFAYHLTLSLASMATPLTMSYGFIRTSPISVKLLTVLTGLLLICSGIVLYLALQSPTPPLQHSAFGVFLVVVLWILIFGLIGFIKMGITTIFRPDPGRGLYYTGVATQVGSLAGAVVIFGLIRAKIFENYDVCKTH